MRLDDVRSINHADWYVSEVLTQAAAYRSTQGFGANTAPNSAALQAINYAQDQLGLPYEWGGNGPAAGITLPRTAQQQYDTGPAVPTGQPLQPGHLVFYGNPTASIHRVGLYIGSNQMIDAPHPSAPIRIEPYRYPGDDYAGATRPSGTSDV